MIRRATTIDVRWVLGLSALQLISWGSVFYGFSVFLEPIEQAVGMGRAQSSLGFSLALLAEGLLAAGVELDRRAMRVMVDDLRWQFEEPQTLCLSFRLPAGSYATGLLRELVTLSE